ncbi:very short patch repair endonuclease [Pseudomonas syringae pv. actinidifoliorum]|nr:very short patch repair endonuclease [Pseudomonas syringae pv. actinidifoliorum]NAT62908.1 very short patch repair endonuclease [Pseudomonas syringae pv. actinidifoliorum]
MMSGIRSKNTKPELFLRRFLHKKGFRFRLHQKIFGGRPDLVLKKYKLAVFVHGCFWHRHLNCNYATTPSSRAEFWVKKFEDNTRRDKKNIAEFLCEDWRVLVVWECGLKHSKDNLEYIVRLILSDEKLMIWPITPPKKYKAGL